MKEFLKGLVVIALLGFVLSIEYRAEKLDRKVQTLQGAENPRSGVLLNLHKIMDTPIGNFFSSSFSDSIPDEIKEKRLAVYRSSAKDCLNKAKGWADGGERWDYVQAWMENYKAYVEKVDIKESVIAQSHVDIALHSIERFARRGDMASVASAEKMYQKYVPFLATNKN